MTCHSCVQTLANGGSVRLVVNNDRPTLLEGRSKDNPLRRAMARDQRILYPHVAYFALQRITALLELGMPDVPPCVHDPALSALEKRLERFSENLRRDVAEIAKTITDEDDRWIALQYLEAILAHKPSQLLEEA